MTARLAALLATCVPIACLAATAQAGTKQQDFFRDALVNDTSTTSAVKKTLQSGATFVDPTATFGDLTGDGKSDAIVTATTGGAAGAIAVYVFSTDGGTSDKLRVVFRSQQLYRASVRAHGGGFAIRTPEYQPGDALATPAKLLERTYAWAAKRKAFRATGTREIAGPGAQQQQPPQPQG
jgi:hypothetical protein